MGKFSKYVVILNLVICQHITVFNFPPTLIFSCGFPSSIYYGCIFPWWILRMLILNGNIWFQLYFTFDRFWLRWFRVLIFHGIVGTCWIIANFFVIWITARLRIRTCSFVILASFFTFFFSDTIMTFAILAREYSGSSL